MNKPEMEITIELLPLYKNLNILKNMIVGASQADVSPLVVSSEMGGLEGFFFEKYGHKQSGIRKLSSSN
ncbi:hypothetical protein [Pseudomonas sp. SDO52101_S400]